MLAGVRVVALADRLSAALRERGQGRCLGRLAGPGARRVAPIRRGEDPRRGQAAVQLFARDLRAPGDAYLVEVFLFEGDVE
jgi:hypothetical protein